MLEKIMDLQILFCIMAAAGAFGAVGMLAVHLTYRRILRRTNAVTSLKEKWLNLWKTRDKLLNRMNLLVWIPSLLSTGCLVLAVWFVTRLDWTDGLPLRYLYLGTVIPVGLMILRQALDFAYREETGDEFSCGLYFVCENAKRRNRHFKKVRTCPCRAAGKSGSCTSGGNGGEDHSQYPADCCYRKSFQQNA